MGLKKYRTEQYKRLPDLAGASYDDIEKVQTRSVRRLINFLKSFLDYTDPDKVEKSPPITACMLVAPWGLGKTTTYDLHIKNLLDNETYIGYPIKIRAQDISNFYDTFNNKNEFKNIPGNADRFLFLIVKVLCESIEFKTKFPSFNSNLPGVELIQSILTIIQSKFRFFLIFLDELEEVVKGKNNVIPFILKAIKDLLNGSSNIINEKANPNLFHFLSFIISCTDAAIYEISRHEELVYQYGGIKRRIHEEHILDISLEESIDYLHKLNKYCYNGNVVDSFINPGAIYNVIARMAMKNPGYMKSYFTKLMSKAGSSESGDIMRQIDGFFLLDNLKNEEIIYMETPRRALNYEVFNNWFEKFKNNKLLKDLLYILIGEIKAFSLDQIIQRFEEELQEHEILNEINLFNQYIESIHPEIKNAILTINLFNDDITSADLQNILTNIGIIIEESEEFVYVAKFEEADIPLDQFYESISYFEIEKSENIVQKFYFSLDKDILKQIFPYLNDPTITILRNQFKKHMNLEKDNLILNPALFSLIFPLPIPQEYNLLDNKNETVRLWTEISRTKKSEIYKNQITEIISNFLIMNRMIKKSSIFEILNLKDIPYFENIVDKNQFIIFENSIINDLSDEPINILFWRELGDYDNATISNITQKIGEYQKIELMNIHLVILISQKKITETLINDLSKNLEYSVVKELPLSQFDITKYAFLHEVHSKYGNHYDPEKFQVAINNLITPFNDIVKSCKDDIEDKGLSLKLNSYISPLSNIPQLMKYLIYDFHSDFSNYENIELIKPFDKINPIGLSPHYSSSIDDLSNDTLKNNITNYLFINGYVTFNNSRLEITMPKIQQKIYQLIKNLDHEKKSIPFENLKNYFFDKSSTSQLLKDVFLTDLENRGLIYTQRVKKVDFIRVLHVKDSELTQKLNDIKKRINLLKIKDHNFYHVFTMKQKGYKLVFLDDFIYELDSLLELKNNNLTNPDVISIRKILFNRIYEVIDFMFSQIFTPLNIKLSNFKEKLEQERNEKYRLDYINNKLKKFGLKDIDISGLSDIKKLDDKYAKIIEKIENPININDLTKRAKEYFKINKTNVKVAGEPFSFHKLSQKEKTFSEPYLNLVFHDVLEYKKQYLESQIIKKIEEIITEIKNVDDNYLEIKAHFTTSNFSGKIAPIIYEKAKELSDFSFISQSISVETLDQVLSFLVNLNKEISKIVTPVSLILRKKGKQSKSRLDRIYFFENEINDLKIEISQNLEFIKQKELIKNVDVVKPITSLDYSELIAKIQNSQNLNELEEVTEDIYNNLNSETDSLRQSLSDMQTKAIEYFSNYKDFNYLEKSFKSLKMDGYADLCRKFHNQLKRFLIDGQDFKNVCTDLLNLLTRIDKGYEEGLSKKLNPQTQQVFLEINEKFESKKYFTESDIESIAKKYNLTRNDIINELLKNNLIEKRYYF